MNFEVKTKHILFITSSRIGDAVLSTGLLNYLYEKNPDAKFTICCGPLAVPLFEGFPALERLIAFKKQKHHRHWVELWAKLFTIKFDIIVDLRNSAISRLIWADKRYIFGNYIDKSKHKVEQNASVMGLLSPPNPKLWFSDEQKKSAAALIPDGDGMVIGVGPAANWVGKTWPSDRFVEIIKWMSEDGGYMDGARVAVFAAPGEEGIAQNVLAAIPESRRIDVIAKADTGVVAAALARCDYYLGNDSGLMHCAAAAGIVTFGLFGPSYPHIYRPWGGNSAYISTPQTLDELISYDEYNSKTCGCLMESLSVDMVKSAIGRSFPVISK